MSDSENARALTALGRALDRLREALAEPEANPLAVDGTIQRFEFAIELSWKALRRLPSRDNEAVARRIYANVRSAFPEMQRTYQLLRERLSR